LAGAAEAASGVVEHMAVDTIEVQAAAAAVVTTTITITRSTKGSKNSKDSKNTKALGARVSGTTIRLMTVATPILEAEASVEDADADAELVNNAGEAISNGESITTANNTPNRPKAECGCVL
jgi:hypothetical protein